MRIVACAAAILVAVSMTLTRPADAYAAPGPLTVGMPIFIGEGRCSLGFFGFNKNEDRLAVTAGHCADRPGQKVYSKDGIEIGAVVSHLGDSGLKQIVQPRGYTLIQVYDDLTVDPFFTDVADAHPGDVVVKYGARTEQTAGEITDTRYNGDRPELAALVGNVITLPGDSGSPWYIDGTTLIGISASGNYDRGGGDDMGSVAQPIVALVKLIRDGSVWGSGFKVWLA